MKLYIPTCTLNFNNIFSSESISPSSFYQKRGFGNKRFYSVPANDIEDMLVLYSKFPRYKLESSDMENYPMIIEIETDDYQNGYFQKVKEMDGVDVYVCLHTIYLNPFHSIVYFYSYEERQGVLTKAEQSLENKFSKLYSANLLVKPEAKRSWLDKAANLFTNSEREDFSWDSSFVNFDQPSHQETFKDDVIVDRIKGFLYCYLIGANQSVSAETGKLKAIARNLRNTLSAVYNSPDKRPTKAQDDFLVESIKEFNHIYSSKDEDAIRNKTILENKLNANPLGLSVKDCVTLLKSWSLYDTFCSKINLKKVYDAGELWSCLEYSGADTYSRVIDNLNFAVRRIENADIASLERNSIAELAVIEDGRILKIVDKSYNTNFFQKLILSQIQADYKTIMDENGVEEPLAQAFNGGQILMKIMGEKWDNSPVSKYIEALLNHFQESTSFDLYSFDNDVAMSFAAFCQKGDNIERLAEYLVQCGFSNYKLAYGIYGATRGFASLPKTFTSCLINGDKDYYRTNFLLIYSQLFGVNLKDAEYILHKQGNASQVYESQIGSTIIENISKIERNPVKQVPVINAVSNAVVLEDAVQSPKAFMFILDSFPKIKVTKAYKNLEAADFANDNGTYSPETFKAKIYSIVGKDALKTQKDKIDKAIELESKRQDREAFLNILDNFLSPSSAAYKRIVELLAKSPTVKETFVKPKQDQNQTETVKKFAKSSLFISDKNCQQFLSSFAPQSIRPEFIDDLKWFQDEYAKGEASKYYGSSSRENDATIRAFMRYIEKKKYANSIDLNQMSEYLYKLYVR